LYRNRKKEKITKKRGIINTEKMNSKAKIARRDT